MRGDLHIHSRYSDGSLEFDEIANIAKNYSLDYISFTDHDCLHYFEQISAICNSYNIKAISGVELSCTDFSRGRRVHILCYNAQKPHILKPICDEVMKSRINAGNIMTEKVSKIYNILPEAIKKYASQSECIYKQHIMHALMDYGYTLKIYSELYDKLFGNNEGSCYVKVKYIDVRDVLTAVHDACGKAIIAHPGVYDSFELLDELISEKSIDGIEVWHPKHSKKETEYLYDKAISNNLIATGGSDFHGIYNSTVSQIGKCFTPKEYIDMLLN